MSNSVTVKICGEEFKLITENSIEYTQAVGMHVNAEMQKMLSTRMGRMDAAIMAALNIADDLFKVRLTDEQLRAQIKSALDAEASAKAEANAFKRENLSLQKKLEKAEKALSKAEKSLQKAQKSSAPDNADAASALPLDEAAMADIVEKSKRPRKTRKAKAEAVKVETVEEVEAVPEAEAEPAPEVEVEAVPEVETEAAPETVEVEAEEATETAAEAE